MLRGLIVHQSRLEFPVGKDYAYSTFCSQSLYRACSVVFFPLLCVDKQSKHKVVRAPDLSETKCPFPRIEVIFLYTQLHKELGVPMDLRISYDDPAAILSPKWKLCSWIFRSLLVFVWSPTPLILKHVGRCCTADIELKGYSE